MKMVLWIPITAGILSSISTVYGNIVFSQDFSGSSTLADYVSATPDAGQWNAISTASISGERIGFTRSSTFARGFARSTDFEPAPEALIFRFDLEVTGASRTASAAVLQIGSGFANTIASETSTKVHSQLTLNLDGNAFGFRMGAGSSGTYMGQFPITWVINNSGSPVQYLGPNDKMQEVGNDQWELWVGTSLLGPEQLATSPDRALTDLKFTFTGGSGTIWMDDFSVETIPAVPEPAETGVLAAICLGVFALASRLKARVAENRTAVILNQAPHSAAAPGLCDGVASQSPQASRSDSAP